MKIAFLTCANRPELLAKEQALAAKLCPKICADIQVWNDPSVNWKNYNYLIFRSIWDYFCYPEAFSTYLAYLQMQQIRTVNPIEVVQRNLHKFYLQDMQAQGIAIIPTVFLPKNTTFDLSCVVKNNWQKAVIKPAVSGGAFLTKVFEPHEIENILAEYTPLAATRDFLVQPFMSEIVTDGEISLLFFQKVYQYSVLKKPKKGDFRVQSEFGGLYRTYEPDENLLKTAQNIIETFGGDLLYARVDGIMKDGIFLLMELELIEPDLYFDFSPNAEQNFLTALENIILK